MDYKRASNFNLLQAHLYRVQFFSDTLGYTNVFFNRDNNKFISGWLLKNDQLDNMVNRGAL